ncbi:MAG: efflux RND transporter permease subunit [Bacteroidaceae bacterium]|nr:efflux RND transporter permease subunit [Bacteroidaceae bacterium]
MLNKIIYFSLHNRLLVTATAMLLFVMGFYITLHTEVDVFPDLNAPTVVVMTEANGMAAEEVEKLVTFPIETAVNGAANVRRVRSTSTSGFSVVWVEFDWDADAYLARQIVSEKLAAIGDQLPESVDSPVMAPMSSLLGEMLMVGLTADSTSMQELRTIADWTIRPRLLSVGGVAQVSVIGGDIKEYQILLDLPRMKHYGVTVDDVLAATKGMNQNSNGGVMYQYGNEYIIRGSLSTANLDELRKAVVKMEDGMPITLDQVTDVQIGSQEPRLGTASVKGKSAVLLTINKQPHVGTLDLTAKIDATLADIQRNLPADVRMETDMFRQSRFIDASIGNVKDSLIEGTIFVVLVIFLFLMNVRTTFISLVTLPLSILVAMIILNRFGVGINTMSLGGIAIAIGSLVDDAIVDVENVWKHLSANKNLPEEQRLSVKEVVFNASKEVRMPILNSTLIIVTSFVPLFFLDGMEGRMLVPLGIAFIVSLFASTCVALTLTPVLCSFLLGGKQADQMPKEAFVSVWLKKYYSQALDWALRNGRVILIGTGVAFALALVGLLSLGRSFLPPFNEGSYTINVSTIPGASLEESENIGRRAEEILMTIPEIYTVARKTGRAELDEHALGVNVSEIEAPFELKNRSKREMTAEIRQKLSALSGVNIEIGQPITHRMDHMMSGTKAGIAIKLFGTDLSKMYQLATQIKNHIDDVEGVTDLNVEQLVDRPELSIVPRREMLARYGITLPELNEFIAVAMAGETVSQVYEADRVFNLVVRAKANQRDEMDKLGNLMIDTADGQKIPLSYVAEVRSTMGPNSVSRENVKRKIVISANADGRDLRSVVNEIRERVEENVPMPEGYHVEYGGQFESEESATRILVLTSLLSILVIFLLLYMEFQSAQNSAIILINLPLALIGGVAAIYVTAGELSIPAIIGFISLFGIATRNGMLLISHYNQLCAQGMSLQESVRQGSLDRLNPILMTALSSALAMIPLALGGDLSGNEIQSPMAKVILGGLLSATFLNGFLVPVIYLLFNKKK